MDNKDAMSKEEEKKVTDRINELYDKKEKEGLTPEEEAERKERDKKLLANFRAAVKQDVENMVILDKNGKEVTSERPKRAQRKKGLRKDYLALLISYRVMIKYKC